VVLAATASMAAAAGEFAIELLSLSQITSGRHPERIMAVVYVCKFR
jgi:hypothetical protein